MFKNRALLRSRPLKSTFDCKNTWLLFTGMRYNTVFTGVNFVNEAGAPENDCFYKPSEKNYFHVDKTTSFSKPYFSPRRKAYF